LSLLITGVLYNDYIGLARLRLNLPEVAPVTKRVWHPFFTITRPGIELRCGGARARRTSRS